MSLIGHMGWDNSACQKCWPVENEGSVVRERSFVQDDLGMLCCIWRENLLEL